VFTFESATDINADVNMRTLRLSNNVVNSYLLTLQPPTLTVDYTITLPLKPTIAQTTPAPAPVLIDTAGNMSAGNSFDYILPPGVIMPYAANSIPAGWLLCDGGAVSRTTYANLYALVGDAYGPGDGVNTFNVPDLRGIFPRGAGTNANATIVAGGSAGSVGTYQDDALQGHKHTDAGHSHGGYVNSTLYPGWGFAFISGGTGSYNSIANPSATANLGNPTATTYGTPRIASETRPANVTVNYIIKY
jgi:microcystin-dependent protein